MTDPPRNPQDVPRETLHQFPHNQDLRLDLTCAMTTSAPVLITGPAAEAYQLATYIHRGSRRRKGPFSVLDCGRTASADQIERTFADASNGTIFLATVHELTPTLQSAVRAHIVPAGVRVISASSVSLAAAVEAGMFDETLFYRLNQIHLIPGTSVAFA